MSRAFVFLAGFSMMVVELLAAKVSAPFIGSSLYTWTSIIGVVLLGVTLGAWIGGYLSDRIKPIYILSSAFVLSGLMVALAYVSASSLGPVVVGMNWPLWLMSLVFSLCVFLPPAICLAAIQPTAIKSDMASLDSAATVYGTLGAWNAAGSILGVYLAGFLFEAYLSVQLVWFAIAVLLILSGVLMYARHRLPR